MTEVALHSVQNVHLHCQNLQTLPAVNGQGLWGIRDGGEELHMYNRQTDRQTALGESVYFIISATCQCSADILLFLYFISYISVLLTGLLWSQPHPCWTKVCLKQTSREVRDMFSVTWPPHHSSTHTDVIVMRPGGVLCSCLWWSDVPQRRR